MRWFAAIVFFGLPQAVEAQISPFELTLGMHENAVKELVDARKFTILSEKSATSDTEWRSDGFDLYFCKHHLTGIHIPLHSDVASFSRAVESERKVRGEPTFALESRIWGSVEAKWRIEPYRYLSISLTQYREPNVSVDRWLQDTHSCES